MVNKIGILERFGDLSPAPWVGDLSAADVSHHNSMLLDIFESVHGQPIGIHTAGICFWCNVMETIESCSPSGPAYTIPWRKAYGTDAALLVGVWEHYDYSTWNEQIISAFSCDPISTYLYPGLIFALAGNLTAANKYHEKAMDIMALNMASDTIGIFNVLCPLMSMGQHTTSTDLRFKIPDTRRGIEQTWEKIVLLMQWPGTTRIGMDTYDTVFREAVEAGASGFTHEFGELAGSCMSFRGQLISLKACTLMLEPDAGRRAEQSEHFDPPDVKVLSRDLGLQDQIQGNQNGSCIMSRISEEALLVGNVDKAMEYSSEEAYVGYQKWCAHAGRRVTRGYALASAGQLDASRACLEEAVAMATKGDHMLISLRALEGLCLLDGQVDDARFDTRARLTRQLGRVIGTPREVAEVFLDRNGVPTIAVEELMAGS